MKTSGDKIIRIHKAREYRAVVSNKLIQDALLPQLTSLEYRVFLYILSLVKPPKDASDIQAVEYNFNIGELCDVLGLCSASGKNYNSIRKAAKNLRDKSFWLDKGNENYVTVSILAKVWASRASGNIRVKFDEDITPYILNLIENTTRITLIYTLRMSSSYSFGLYLLCRSYAGIYNFSIDYASLRKKLGCSTKYPYFCDFEKRVLNPAMNDINTYSDIIITCSAHRDGYSVSSLNFSIKEKKSLEKYQTAAANSTALDVHLDLHNA